LKQGPKSWVKTLGKNRALGLGRMADRSYLSPSLETWAFLLETGRANRACFVKAKKGQRFERLVDALKQVACRAELIAYKFRLFAVRLSAPPDDASLTALLAAEQQVEQDTGVEADWYALDAASAPEFEPAPDASLEGASSQRTSEQEDEESSGSDDEEISGIAANSRGAMLHARAGSVAAIANGLEDLLLRLRQADESSLDALATDPDAYRELEDATRSYGRLWGRRWG
jgi:hypothetical protein